MKLLPLIEKTGNKLPGPSILFFMGTFLIFALVFLVIYDMIYINTKRFNYSYDLNT